MLAGKSSSVFAHSRKFGEKERREDTMQLSRGKLVASFAAVTLGGVLLAMLGMAITSPNNPPMAPATPVPATLAPATPAPAPLALATPEKQAPLKPALP